MSLGIVKGLVGPLMTLCVRPHEILSVFTKYHEVPCMTLKRVSESKVLLMISLLAAPKTVKPPENSTPYKEDADRATQGQNDA